MSPPVSAATLRAGGMTVAVSAPRRDPALLHEAIREAELLVELGGAEDTPSDGHDETYRLLIGVLLRDRAELEQLRDSTVTPLADYDAPPRHRAAGRRCAPSWPTTARPPRRPRRCSCTATRSATACRGCRRCRACRPTSQTGASG